MSEAMRLTTATELEKFPRDDRRYELVAGRLVPMTPVGWMHGAVVTRLLVRLAGYVESTKLGVAFTEVGFRLASNPDTVRAPDVAFIRQERLSAGVPRGFWQGSPDLAIEVLSPDDRPGEIRDKVVEYLAHDVSLVVVIDPDDRTASVFRQSSPPVGIDADGVLDLDDVVPGFRYRLGDLFEI